MDRDFPCDDSRTRDGSMTVKKPPFSHEIDVRPDETPADTWDVIDERDEDGEE